MPMTQESLLRLFLEEYHSGNGITAHTSGSTGKPKEIKLSREIIDRSAARTNRFFGINRHSHLHCAISFQFIGGKMMIARSLRSGCRLTYSEPSLTPLPPDIENKIDLMSVVPAQMSYIIQNADKFERVRRFLIGGSRIDDRLWNKIVESGIETWESYGMTETASHIALRRVTGQCNNRPRFVALRGVQISESKDHCLQIKDLDIRIKTNDIVELHKDHSFEIIGRKDNVIISGGLKIQPEEIERKLFPFIQNLVKAFYITSVPDEIWSSKMILAIVEPKVDILRIKEEIDKIPDSVIPSRFRPKELRILDSLPLTQSGKLKR